MRDLFYFTVFVFVCETQSFRTSLGLAGQFLCLEMIHDLSSVKPLLFGQILPVKEVHTSLLPSPGQHTRTCWPVQRHIELLAALEPLPSHLLTRDFPRPPEFSTQLMSYSLFCHQVDSREMLWGGFARRPSLACLPVEKSDYRKREKFLRVGLQALEYFVFAHQGSNS